MRSSIGLLSLYFALPLMVGAFTTIPSLLSSSSSSSSSSSLQHPSLVARIRHHHATEQPVSESSSLDESTSTTPIDSIETATSILQKWDKHYTTGDLQTESPEELDLLLSSIQPRLSEAVLYLNTVATEQRDRDPTTGRCLLGICASDGAEGLATLKSWVTALGLPRGLLHGMDKDGVPLNLEGSVYIKYNSGGVYTFEDIRKSGLGFDALWKPGDALLELYDGTYRGVYFQVELMDGEFRQYLVPIDIFGLE